MNKKLLLLSALLLNVSTFIPADCVIEQKYAKQIAVTVEPEDNTDNIYSTTSQNDDTSTQKKDTGSTIDSLVGSFAIGSVIGTIASFPLSLICHKIFENTIPLRHIMGAATGKEVCYYEWSSCTPSVQYAEITGLPVYIPVALFAGCLIAKVVVKKIWGDKLRRKLMQLTQTELDNSDTEHNKEVMNTGGRLAAWFFTLMV